MSLPRPIRIECSRSPAAGHKRRPARGTFSRACLLAALLALPPVLLVALVALPRWRAAAQRASAAAGAGPWDPSGRITLLRAQVASRRWDPEAYLALARACVRAGADCDAAEAYAKAIELGAGGAGVHRQLGDAYRRLGDVAEAEREYCEALRVDSVPAGPALALIELYLEAGRKDDARQLFQRIEGDARPAAPSAAIGPAPTTPAGGLPVSALERMAVAFQAAGDFDTALQLGERLAAAQPDSPAGHAAAGRALLALRRRDEAFAALRRASRLSPGDPELHYLVGFLLAQRGSTADDTEALRELVEAVRLQPEHGRASYETGLLLARRRDWKRAAVAFLAAARYGPRPVEAVRRAAEAFDRAGQREDALRCMGQYQLRRGNYAAALDASRARLRAGADPVQVAVDQAEIYREMEEPRSALAAMQQAAGRRPESAEIQRLLAAAYAGVQDTGHRIEALQRAIALDPARADEAYDDLGGIYRSTGRYDEAEACYRKCLEQRPEHAAYHYVLAKTLLMRSDREGYLQQAIAHLEKAVTLDPEDATSWQLLGVALTHAGRLPEAALVFQRALAADQQLEQACLNAGQVYLRLGQAEKSRRMLARFQRYRDFNAQRQALQTRATERPDDAEAQFRLGELALRARQYEAAAEQFERAIVLAPGHAAAHAGLAAAYGALGRPEDQAAELQTAASLRRAAKRGTV